LTAYKDMKKSDFDALLEEAKDKDIDHKIRKFAEGMTMIALYGLMDPLKDKVIKAIGVCKRAGVTVRMVTGDNVDTATAIAKEARILDEEFDPDHIQAHQKYTCLTGKQFRDMIKVKQEHDAEGKLINEEIENIEDFDIIQRQLRVLARSTPIDKYNLVMGLKQLGKVVAVTGDGTNDAPALHKAHVGFSMGIAGTDVAKNASAIILLDDNFASTKTAILWGRNIYGNVRKFLQF
jgi:P-type Ca2+ transporter type 2B